MIRYTAAEEGLANMDKLIAELKADLYRKMWKMFRAYCTVRRKTRDLKLPQKYGIVARAENFIDQGVEYTGALQILKVILSYDYLWQNV